EPPLECAECGRGFGQKPDLVRHRLAHGGERAYACGRCGRGFAEPVGLGAGAWPTAPAPPRHQRLRAGECPCQCPACGKSSNDESNRGKHHRIHTGERPHRCPAGGKGFIQKHQR
ncbi:ZSC21 protein, partial [Cochlearius cochlearius]|nr:ZSC21 protein [Cochlearius cochlearius]